MKKWFLQRLTFVGKSLLWSAVLYIAFMMVFNWDEMSAGFKKYHNAVAIQHVVHQAAPMVSSNETIDNNSKNSVVIAIAKTVFAEFGKIIHSSW